MVNSKKEHMYFRKSLIESRHSFQVMLFCYCFRQFLIKTSFICILGGITEGILRYDLKVKQGRPMSLLSMDFKRIDIVDIMGW